MLYNILPEKWLSVHNLEIWQPWQGLLEFSTSLFTYLGTDWMTKLLVWLTKSGFDAFHFTPSNWTVEEINRLRALFQKLKVQLSLSFSSSEKLCYSDILFPVKSIWLYDPQANNAEGSGDAPKGEVALSEEDKKRLKEELLQEMINNKKKGQ